MKKKICVFASSSNSLPAIFFSAAIDLGQQIVKAGFDLIYGGSNVGSMHQIALTVKKLTGNVIGIIPEFLYEQDLCAECCDEIIITSDMYERKKLMLELADAFIAFPGGYGTLDEIIEILTYKNLHLHNKPVVFLNIENFFSHLLDHFEKLISLSFIPPDSRSLYYITENFKEALTYISKLLH